MCVCVTWPNWYSTNLYLGSRAQIPMARAQAAPGGAPAPEPLPATASGDRSRRRYQGYTTTSALCWNTQHAARISIHGGHSKKLRDGRGDFFFGLHQGSSVVLGPDFTATATRGNVTMCCAGTPGDGKTKTEARTLASRQPHRVGAVRNSLSGALTPLGFHSDAASASH